MAKPSAVATQASPQPTQSSGERPGGWIPQGERLLSAWNIGFVLTGLLLFLGGTILQMVTPKYPEIDDLVRNCVSNLDRGGQAVSVCRDAVVSFDRKGHAADELSVALAAADLLRAIGSALILSIIISVTLERQNRSQFMDALANKTRELTLSVFAGMFNRNHPDALLTAVKSQILERDLIRDSISVAYTLSIWEPRGGGDVPKGRTFIRVDVILSSTITNVSTLKGVDAGVASVPLGLALPNPMIDALKDDVTVAQFLVGGAPLDAETLRTANEKLREDLKDDEREDVQVDFGSREIQPGESLSISANYTMLKEAEDTEVFRTLQIARSLSLTVNDNTGGRLKVRARSIHPSSLEKMASGSATTQWRLSDIILPQQGIMVWWKAPSLIDCNDRSETEAGVDGGN